MATKICPHCGVEIDENATRCYNCQQWLSQAEVLVSESKPQDFLSTLLFAWFLGVFGVHRFWTGHYAIGVAQLLTFGGCGIWAFVDLILLCFNKFRDSQDRELRDYSRALGIAIFILTLIPALLLILLLMVILGIIVVGSAS